MTSGPTQATRTRPYAYDGMGRLTYLTDQIQSSVAWTRYAYDDSSALILETHSDERTIFRFRGHRYDALAGTTHQKLLPMLALEDGKLRWTLMEPDGHALEVTDVNVATLHAEVLGVYGADLPGLGGSSWPIDGFHGRDVDDTNGLAPMGVRHMRLADGLWLQPEPLLYLGPTNADLRQPRLYSGVYAGGDPVNLRDRTGLIGAHDDHDWALPTEHTGTDGVWSHEVTKLQGGLGAPFAAAGAAATAVAGGIGGGKLAEGAVAAVLTRLPGLNRLAMGLMEPPSPTGTEVGVGTGTLLATKTVPGAMAGRRLGHTLAKHGAANTDQLLREAEGSGRPVGQWLDDAAAEQFVADHVDELSHGAKTFDLPEGLGRIIHPDGTFTPATKARLVPSKSGVKTAYPDAEQ